MVDINLLGEKNKKISLIGNIARIINIITAFTIIIVLIFAVLIIIFNQKISKEANINNEKFSDLQKEETNQEEIFKQEIKTINSKINYIGEILDKNKNISNSIDALSEILDSEIKISLIEIETDKRTILIKGTGSRANFLKFHFLLENSGKFFNIHSPLSNITKKDNIEFSISADIKENILK